MLAPDWLRGDRIVAVNGQPIGELRQVLDTFGRSEPGTAVDVTIARQSVTRTEHLVLEARRVALAARIGNSASLLTLDVILTFYPVAFFVVAAIVLLQRPDDRNAWAMALAFGGLIAAAPLLPLESVMHPALRPFMLGMWVLLSTMMPASFYFFFAVFPQQSAIDRRAPWLKYALGVVPGIFGVIVALACVAAGTSAPLAWIEAREPGDVLGKGLLGYWLAGIGLALASLVTNAFGPPESRRKTRVILAGTLLGQAPIVGIIVFSALTGGPDSGRRVPFVLLGARRARAELHPAVGGVRGRQASRDGTAGAAAPQRALSARAAGRGDGGDPSRHGHSRSCLRSCCRSSLANRAPRPAPRWLQDRCSAERSLLRGSARGGVRVNGSTRPSSAEPMTPSGCSNNSPRRADWPPTAVRSRPHSSERSARRCTRAGWWSTCWTKGPIDSSRTGSRPRLFRQCCRWTPRASRSSPSAARRSS